VRVLNEFQDQYVDGAIGPTVEEEAATQVSRTTEEVTQISETVETTTYSAPTKKVTLKYKMLIHAIN
jgi:hypothetical protein